jgi:hypothetical protein
MAACIPFDHFDSRQNLRGQLADVAGAEGEDQVAFIGLGGDGGNGGGKVRRKLHRGPSMRSASRSAVTPGMGSSLAA